MFDPTLLDLKGLFPDPDILDSNSRWRKAGFAVEGEGGESDIMVASHPSAHGYLFKKYSKKVSPKDQLKNYRRRIKGAEKIKALVTIQHLTKIVVPGKHLHELSASSYVLVVERLTLLSTSRSKEMYGRIDNETLRQLCVVLRAFRGLDSGARNVPFTEGGQIAFVDTERWNDDRKVPLKRIREYLSDQQWEFAEALFKT